MRNNDDEHGNTPEAVKGTNLTKGARRYWSCVILCVI